MYNKGISKREKINKEKKMKKSVIVALMLGLLSFPFNVKAEGIAAGQHKMFLSVGGVTSLERAGFSQKEIGFVDNKEMKWGTYGATAGLSYAFFPSEYFGIGLEANDAYFDGKKYTTNAAGHKYETKTGMNVLNALLSMRFNLNPKHKYRVYIPFGGGYAWSTNLLENKDTFGGNTTTKKYRNTAGSFGYFVGLGLEMDLGERWSLGLEGRYNGFTYDTNKIAEKDDKDSLVGDKDYTYVSASLKLGYRF